MAGVTGALVLVVGPSGAGKDTVMRGAAAELSGNPRYVFPKRVVTREADATAEDHDSMSLSQFNAALAMGDFMLSWQAHGNCYGIPETVADAIAQGQIAVINVSRHILHEAAEKYPNIVIAEINADIEVRIARIQNRGREQAEDALKRASRETPKFPEGVKIIRIENNGAAKSAIAQFTEALKQL